MDAAALVDAFLAAVVAKDLDTALTYVTDDVVYDNVPMRAVTGPAEIRAALAPFLAAYSRIDWVVRHQVAQGNVVMNERVDRFERADGTWLELPVAGVFEVVDGKIALWRDYFDLGSFQRQLQG